MSGHKSKLRKDVQLMELNFKKGETIFFQSWVKYFHHPDNFKEETPKNFYQNNEFFHQRYTAVESKKKDSHGTLVIPDQYNFYAVVYNNTVAIYSARDKIIRKQVDSFQIDRLKDVPEDKILKGGIEDMNKHFPGHCMKAQLTIPTKFREHPTSEEDVYGQHWVFCFDKPNNKAQMMKTLIKLKLEKQRRAGQYLMYQKDKKKPLGDINKTFKSGIGEKTDGIMVMIWDWSDCTLKCGGGFSYQQWMCIPPKNGGKACQGDLIRKKECNTQKCPPSDAISEMQKDNPKIREPIIKIGKFSSRLNRYSKCVIKETDIFRDEYDTVSKKSNKIPGRLVMNNSTISIYDDDSFNKLVYTFHLQKTNFIMEKEFCCFSLQDTIEKKKLCGFSQSCGTQENNKFVKDWSDAFKLFKVDCFLGKQVTLITMEDEMRLAQERNKKIGESNAQFESEKASKARDQIAFGEQKAITSKVTGTEKTGLKALEKEMQLEDLLKNEEKQREEMEIAKIAQQIEEEKKKANCLNSNIKEKEIDEMFIQDKRDAEQEVKDIKRQISQSVLSKRSKLKKQLEEMKKLANIRKSQMRAKLRALRQSMARNLMLASKAGEIDKCSKGTGKTQFREEFCDSHIPDDYLVNADCKLKDNFCYVCCEHEFGNLHLDRRSDCYDSCDGNRVDNYKKPEMKLDQWKWKTEE